MGGPSGKCPAMFSGAAVARTGACHWLVLGAVWGIVAIAGCRFEKSDPPRLQPPAAPLVELVVRQPSPGPIEAIYEDGAANVVVTFARPTFLQGDVYLTTDRGMSLAMTRESRRGAQGPEGAELLTWDRRVIDGPFVITGWERSAAQGSLTDREGRVVITAGFEPAGIGPLQSAASGATLPASPTPGEVAVLLLERLNQWRWRMGAPPLKLGSNPVAERHAHLGLRECTSSHWDVYGLKPYQRYALTGGIQYVEENWGGTTSFCVTEEDRLETSYVTGSDMSRAVEELLAAFTSSERHSTSLLDPFARYAHVGVAWDPRNLKVSLLLERHLVNDHPAGMFSLSPAGELVVWGSFRESADLAPGSRLRVYYEDFPKPLTRGQLARTTCYTVGQVLVAVVVAPDSARRMTDVSRPHCPEPPEGNTADAREPRNEAEGLALHRSAAQGGQGRESVWAVPASVWEYEGRSFLIEADVSIGMLRTGRSCAGRVCPGVYTVQLEVLTEDGEVVTAAQQTRWLGGAPAPDAERFYVPVP